MSVHPMGDPLPEATSTSPVPLRPLVAVPGNSRYRTMSIGQVAGARCAPHRPPKLAKSGLLVWFFCFITVIQQHAEPNTLPTRKSAFCNSTRTGVSQLAPVSARYSALWTATRLPHHRLHAMLHDPVASISSSCRRIWSEGPHFSKCVNLSVSVSVSGERRRQLPVGSRRSFVQFCMRCLRDVW